MKGKSAKTQVLFLTTINGVVRGLGLLMRVVLSRILGAEVMGIMELSQSIHMVAITPLTSGLPTAISRMTARARPAQRALPLRAGLHLVRRTSLGLIPLLWLLSPVLARLTGDVRTLPSLLFSAPCILVLGYSAAYNGYCYGTDASHLPAMSELIEQVGRFVLTLLLVAALRHLTAAWMAALTMIATCIAELIGLWYVTARLAPLPAGSGRDMCRPVFRLAFPSTLTRLVQTLLRSLTAILIPLRLQESGLSFAEATARLGMFNGMVMPILLLPCIFTSALAMIAMPRIAKVEEQPPKLRRLLLQCISACIPCSLVCAAGIHLCAPLLSVRVYRLAELADLFRICAPLTVLMSLGHLSGSVLSALGQQRRSFYASCAVSGVTLALTWLWAGNAELRLNGVIAAQYAGQTLSILLSLVILRKWRKERQNM